MDQHKNQGDQRQGGPQPGQKNFNQNQNQPQTPNPNREPAEGSRPQQAPGQSTERGKGPQGEQNRGDGIGNRGMDRDLEEQEELPDRGSRQSER